MRDCERRHVETDGPAPVIDAAAASLTVLFGEEILPRPAVGSVKSGQL
jgi:hypothetical protein